ncbi:MAG: TonB-dependent receptor domain-containing protein [Kiritimatiellia bacterium]
MYRSSLVGAVLVVSAVFAQSPETHQLSPLQVSRRALPESRPDSRFSLASEQERLGATLDSLPGVALRSQGAHGGEPVLRGLGWERVSTQYNGLCLYGACPSRMDPPVNLFSAASLQEVLVELGPPSVIYGPLSTGGRIRISDDLNFAPAGEKTYAGSAQASFGSNGKNREGLVRAGGSSEQNAWQVHLGAGKTDDYFSGDGKRVPAGSETEEASAQWKQRIAEDLFFDLNTRWVYEKDVKYLSLPMDSRYAKTNIYQGKLQWVPDGQNFTALAFQAGFASVDHLMDNRDKANRMMMQASTPSTADSYNAGLLGRWNLYKGELRAGIDASLLERDALRTRTMTATGMSFQDPIWPDLSSEQAGVFSEWEGPVAEKLHLRAGLRLDRVLSDAGKADAMIVPGPGDGKPSVSAAWRDVGGSTATDAEQEDTLMSANLILAKSLSETWTSQIGFGRTEASPNLTQRYLSFGPVPGGFGVGTPSLEPETKYEIELRTEGRIGPHPVGFAAFAARIDDYLLPTTLAMADVNGDGRVDRIRGTVNQDAEMWGLEASGELRLSRGISLPVQLGWVRGQTTEGKDLPEIPPLEIHTALRWEAPSEQNSYAEFGMRFAYRQDRIDPEFGEDATPSFAVLHLRGGTEIRPGWTLEAGIENLLDREYHEHLTREVLLPEGDLMAGDEVPNPGRTFTLSTRINW